MDSYSLASLASAFNFMNVNKNEPFKRPKRNSTETLLKHANAVSQMKNQLNSDDDHFEVNLNPMTVAKRSSLRRIDELRPILLREMFVNKVHEGRYLLCRIVGEPVYITAISMVVEDETGETEQLSLYDNHQENRPKRAPAHKYHDHHQRAVHKADHLQPEQLLHSRRFAQRYRVRGLTWD